MYFLRRTAVVALIFAGTLSSPVSAQQLPSPDQARRLLETRPDLVAALRREIASSGLTSEQIRARLRAAGYPDDLLDGYLSTTTMRTTRDSASSLVPSLSSLVPNEDVVNAVSALGMTDPLNAAELRGMLRRRRANDEPTPSAPDTGQAIFGLNVFENATTQFDPNLAGPVDASYKLGPGDRLVLLITGDAERSYTLDVTREGFVVIPGVGEVPVANLTLGQLEDQLYSRLGRVYSGLRRGADATTHFAINIARLRSNQVYVLGDVVQPSSYRISSAGTALTALYAAGGPTRNGGMRRVEIRRGGKLVDTLDLYDYFLRADGSHDPRLQSGDVVFVPVHGPRVRLYGEVVRPGTYELRQNESLVDLLRSAGGFTADASRQRVQVSRILPPSQRDTSSRARVVIDVTASQPNSEETPAFPLETGDVVRVFRVSERVGRSVNVQGHVGSPGVVGFTAGMHLSDAIRLAGGLKPDAYLDQVLISRLRGADSSRVQLRAAFRDSTGRPRDDITLSEDDEIRVFAVTEFRTPEYVVITGAVRQPGRFPYREGITLRDLVMLAGGLDTRASLRDAEIARLPRTREPGQLAVSERFSLDSSYLFAGRARETGSVAQAGTTRDIPLRPYDNVLIPTDLDLTQTRQVVITGEVKAPGTYTLLTKSDRLGDLLKRAGGLTNAAYVDGIVFTRASGKLGRVGLDLRSVLRDSTSRDNLILADGDSIYLPQFSGLVEVRGAVHAPRGVAWIPGRALDYYVHAAGGPTSSGDVSRSYVMQPDGSVETVRARRLLPDDVPVPRPGSVVTVTERSQKQGSDSVARLSIVAQIVASMVALAAVLRRQ